jgi:predicted nucleic acid-binding protein
MSAFLDTSVLLAGLVDFGTQSAPAASILLAVVERRIPKPATAWHCCLEFFSVATRLPPEYRLTPADADRLLSEEVFPRFDVHDLPSADRGLLLRTATQDAIAGGRIYDAHIAAVARAARADLIVTDNRRHFITALRHGIRVETPSEFLSAVRPRKP